MQSEKYKLAKKRCRSSKKGKATIEKWRNSERGKAILDKWRNSERGKSSLRAAHQRFRSTDKCKAIQKRAQAKYRSTEKWKVKQRRYMSSEKGKAHNAKRVNQLTRSLYQMVRGVHPNPQSFRSFGLFDNNADAEAFFESTKTEEWMKTAPWGACTTTTLPQTVLQIGHHIPKAWYRHDDDGDD